MKKAPHPGQARAGVWARRYCNTAEPYKVRVSERTADGAHTKRPPPWRVAKVGVKGLSVSAPFRERGEWRVGEFGDGFEMREVFPVQLEFAF